MKNRRKKVKVKNFKTYGLNLIIALFAFNTLSNANIQPSDNYEALVGLFKEWR